MEPKEKIETLAVYLKLLRESERSMSDEKLVEATLGLTRELARLCLVHKDSIMQDYGFSEEDYLAWEKSLIRKG